MLTQLSKATTVKLEYMHNQQHSQTCRSKISIFHAGLWRIDKFTIFKIIFQFTSR